LSLTPFLQLQVAWRLVMEAPMESISTGAFRVYRWTCRGKSGSAIYNNSNGRK